MVLFHYPIRWFPDISQNEHQGWVKFGDDNLSRSIVDCFTELCHSPFINFQVIGIDLEGGDS